MARVIVCAGKRGKTPLRIQKSGERLYSAEEICYYFYHNPETAEDFVKENALADFYENELELSEVAGRLRLLDVAEASTKDYAAVIFGVIPMYTTEEITEFMQELEKSQDLSGWQKLKAKADVYLERGNYREAFEIYEKLLREREEHGISEVACGNLYHNLAVCELHTTGPGAAGVHFENAYEKNRSQESLRSYLLALRLAKKDNEFLNALEQYAVPEALRSEIDTRLFGAVIEAGDTAEYQRLMRVKKLLADGQIAEYREATQKLLEEFKRKYREDNL